MCRLSHNSIYTLFLLNLCLQLFDGLATYSGIQMGWQEGNPLLHSAMANWGLEWTLLLSKANACGFLLLLNHLRGSLLSAAALVFTAICYFSFSFLPWLSLLLTLSVR